MAEVQKKRNNVSVSGTLYIPGMISNTNTDDMILTLKSELRLQNESPRTDPAQEENEDLNK